jgi:hypothetical protein
MSKTGEDSLHKEVELEKFLREESKNDEENKPKRN